jgi:hypothetical protein
MSGTFSNMLRSLLGRKAPPEPDMEHGFPETNASGSDPVPHVDHAGRPQLRADDQLNLFRHLTGIISHPSMTHAHRAAGGRAAPNLGIYSRVVHNEQDAKRGYKRFSWLINSCLGLQIIVAAALTAMGAAGASHSAVTVFGAINTVIAGLLTFLKGSGLPNRLKYYQAEWKRIREFIEQRERDFSRPGCDLDVYAVVDIVEKMYDDVKADLEATVPDRFAGIRGGHKALQGANGVSDTNGGIKPAPGALPRVETLTLSEKLKEVESGFGGKVKDLVSDIAHKSHVAHAAQDAARLLEERSKTISDNATKGLRAQAERVQHLDDAATKELNKQVEQAEREQHAQTVGDDATRELNAQFERAHQLEQRTMTMGKETTRELGKEVEHAGHLESSFLAKLKELRSEIGNRANLAQEAMHYLQAAYHHDHHDPNEAGKKAGDHQAETGASS